MKLIDLGEDNKKAKDRFGLLHTVAHAGFAPADEAKSRRLQKIQVRLDDLLENPPSSLVLDDEDVALLKTRVFDGDFKWKADDVSRALDILDVLKAAVEWKPEAEKKPMSVELSRDDAA